MISYESLREWKKIYKKANKKKLKKKTTKGVLGAIKRLNKELAEEVLQAQYEKWSIKRLTPQQLRKMGPEFRKTYLAREVSMLRGTYETKRRQMFKDNMEAVLRDVEIDDPALKLRLELLIDKFLDLAKGKDIDKLAQDMDSIRSWYRREGEDDPDFLERIESMIDNLEAVLRNYEENMEEERKQRAEEQGKPYKPKKKKSKWQGKFLGS